MHIRSCIDARVRAMSAGGDGARWVCLLSAGRLLVFAVVRRRVHRLSSAKMFRWFTFGLFAGPMDQQPNSPVQVDDWPPISGPFETNLDHESCRSARLKSTEVMIMLGLGLLL